MTLERKNGPAKAGQPINTGMSQAVPQNTVENTVFDGRFYIDVTPAGYSLWCQARRPQYKRFRTLDDLMTFLADQAIEKMGRTEQ